MPRWNESFRSGEPSGPRDRTPSRPEADRRRQVDRRRYLAFHQHEFRFMCHGSIRDRNQEGGIRRPSDSRQGYKARVPRDRRRQGGTRRRERPVGQGWVRCPRRDCSNPWETVRDGIHRSGRGTLSAIREHRHREEIVSGSWRLGGR